MMIGSIVWLLKLNSCHILRLFKRKARESGYSVIHGLLCQQLCTFFPRVHASALDEPVMQQSRKTQQSFFSQLNRYTSKARRFPWFYCTLQTQLNVKLNCPVSELNFRIQYNVFPSFTVLSVLDGQSIFWHNLFQ